MDLKGGSLLKMLFEGLTRTNACDVPELALAEDLEISSDLKTYTFKLKESVWSNGDPVTAFDFAYAWKKALSPSFPSDSAFHLYVIKNAKRAKEGKVDLDAIGVHALDAQTLQVELENPTPYFLQLLTFPVFFPINKKVDEANPEWAYKMHTYVSNGPFQLKEWKPQDHLSLEKNAKYWDAERVEIDGIELLMVHADTELSLFEKGELDWVGSPFSTLPTDALPALRQASLLKIKEMLRTSFIRIQTDVPLFRDGRIRRAFAEAIDRKEMVTHLLHGNQRAATSLVPPSLGLQESLYFEDGNREGARALFEEGIAAMGWTRETLPPVSLLYLASDNTHIFAQAIQQQWLDVLGVSVRLQAVELKVYFDRLSKRDYELSLGDWVADFADPINFLEAVQQRTPWKNVEYNRLLDQSYQIADREIRLAVLQQSEKILIEDMPIIPLFIPLCYTLTKKI